jgi:hypothetical protein
MREMAQVIVRNLDEQVVSSLKFKAERTVQPCSSTRCTSRSRPCGIKRAFLCMFIRVISRSVLPVSQPTA